MRKINRWSIALVMILILTTGSMTQSIAAGPAPAQQKQFIEIVKKGAEAYKSAKTDLKSSVALRKRDKDACAVLSNYKANDWVGTIKRIGANSEGKAYIEIEIDSGIRVQTWNNAFSDISDNTLIPEDSKVFNAIIDGESGTKITFSGQFIKGKKSCLTGANLTEYFYATDPKFIAKITAAKLG